MNPDSATWRRVTLSLLACYLFASGVFAWVSVILWRAGMVPSLTALNWIPHLVLWLPSALSLWGVIVAVRGREPRAVLWANALLWILMGAAGLVNLPDYPHIEAISWFVDAMSLLSLGCVWYLLAQRREGDAKSIAATP